MNITGCIYFDTLDSKPSAEETAAAQDRGTSTGDARRQVGAASRVRRTPLKEELGMPAGDTSHFRRTPRKEGHTSQGNETPRRYISHADRTPKQQEGNISHGNCALGHQSSRIGEFGFNI